MLGFALYFQLWVRLWRHETLEALPPLEELEGLAAAGTFTTWAALARLHRGWVANQKAEPDGGVALIASGISGWNNPWMLTHYSSILAEACRRAGRYPEAMDAITVGREHAGKTAEHFAASEIERLAGETLLLMGADNAAEAERCLRRAVAITVEQGAKSFELRATTSLARLLASQGNRDEARTMLATIYNWFSEGFDTKDLKEAKALLDELGT